MKKFVLFQKILILTLTVIIVVCCLTYNYNLESVSKDSQKVIFVVKENETFSSLADDLKDSQLIRSEFIYKIYVKLMNPTGLQAGKYELDRNMDVKSIVEALSKGAKADSITVTFNEGINMRKVISIITENFDITEEEILEKLKDEDYLKELINKYWFLTEDILNKEIYYSLEGYLYPETYQFKEDSTLEEIFTILLNQTDKVLNEYKKEINKSEYSIHEIMTLASIVELEGGSSDDRAGVAGVFYNRLKAGSALGSDVTTYYGAKINMSDRDLYQKEIDEYNAYNTRNSQMAGKLPVGPICNPSIVSIKAVINPTEHNYYYFVADSTKKTYFSKTYNEHINTIKKIKSAGLWYEY